jgi:hypothetical protein
MKSRILFAKHNCQVITTLYLIVQQKNTLGHITLPGETPPLNPHSRAVHSCSIRTRKRNHYFKQSSEYRRQMYHTYKNCIAEHANVMRLPYCLLCDTLFRNQDPITVLGDGCEYCCLGIASIIVIVVTSITHCIN